MPPKPQRAPDVDPEELARLAEERHKRALQEEAEKAMKRERQLLLHQKSDEFAGQVEQIQNDFDSILSKAAEGDASKAIERHWRDYIECSNTPDLLSPKSMHMFFELFHDNQLYPSKDIAAVAKIDVQAELAKIRYAYELARQAEAQAMVKAEVAEATEAAAYAAVAKELQTSCSQKLDQLSAQILQFPDMHLRPQEQDLYVKEEGQTLSLYLYGNIAKNPNYANLSFDEPKPELVFDPEADPDAAPGPEAIAADDTPPQPGLSWPSNLAAASIAVRMSHRQAALIRDDNLCLLEAGAGQLPSKPQKHPSRPPTSAEQNGEAGEAAADGEANAKGDSGQATAVNSESKLDKAEDSKALVGPPAETEGDIDVKLPEIEFVNVEAEAPLEPPKAMTLLDAAVDLSTADYHVEAPPDETEEEASRLTTANKRSNATSARSRKSAKSAPPPVVEPEPTVQKEKIISLTNVLKQDTKCPMDTSATKLMGELDDTWQLVGSSYQCDLLNLPSLPTAYQKWTMRPIEEPVAIQRLSYPLPNAPRVVVEDSDEPVDPKAGMEQWPALQMRFPAPTGIATLNNAAVVRWDDDSKVWTAKDVKLMEVSPLLTLETVVFSTYRIVLPRASYWALDDWAILPLEHLKPNYIQETIKQLNPTTIASEPESSSSLKPSAPPSRGNRSHAASAKSRRLKSAKKSNKAERTVTIESADPNPAGAVLRLQTSSGPVMIEVTSSGCRLVYPETPSCKELMTSMPTPLFIKTMQASGMDVLPALNKHYQPTVPKDAARENELYHQMTLLALEVAMRPSVWNAGVEWSDFVVAALPQAPETTEQALPPTIMPELESIDDLLEQQAKVEAEAEAAAKAKLKAKAKAKKRVEEEEEVQVPDMPDTRALERLRANKAKFPTFAMGLAYWQDQYVYPLTGGEGASELSTKTLPLDKTITATVYHNFLQSLDTSQRAAITNADPKYVEHMDLLLRALRPVTRCTNTVAREFAKLDNKRQQNQEALKAEEEKIENLMAERDAIIAQINPDQPASRSTSARSRVLSARVQRSRQEERVVGQE